MSAATFIATSPGLGSSPRSIPSSSAGSPYSYLESLHTGFSPYHSPRRVPILFSLPSNPSRSAETEQLGAIARMQAKQESWSRVARSSSSASVDSSPDPPSPALSFNPITGSGSKSKGQSGKDTVGGPSSESNGKTKTRRKVAKACLACQKSHLTCDEQRPCTRCVKKGIGEQCTEGVRKKAKYLLEGNERVLQPNHYESVSPSPVASYPLPTQPTSLPSLALSNDGHITTTPLSVSSTTTAQPRVSDDIWLAAPAVLGDEAIDARHLWGDALTGTGGTSGVNTSGMTSGNGMEGLPSSSLYPFGTTAAADEFQMLDAMFGSMSPVFPFDTTPTAGADANMYNFGETNNNQNQTQNQTQNPSAPEGGFLDQWTSEYLAAQNQSQIQNQNVSNLLQSLGGSVPPTQIGSNGLGNQNLTGNGGFDLNTAWAAALAGGQNLDSNDTIPQATLSETPTNFGYTPNSTSSAQDVKPVIQRQDSTAQSEEVRPVGEGPFSLGNNGNGFRASRATPSEVYRTVAKPYDYTEGYHVLMQYLSENFEQRDVLRVVHSLASYRPSLIALQMPMSEEDEVFLEKSFQRTMIELEKLISYSATPTAVWRRTGEVCYANPEFCRLVCRSEGELLGKKNYIYQIFARPSVVTYWENFSVHAFENTTQNFFQPTTLELGNDKPEGVGGDNVQCSACFTIRRDVFDLPSVIIGQFLPIPRDLL